MNRPIAMLRVTIKNIGNRQVHRSGGVELPPPFHLLEIAPGGSVDTFCTMEQMESQWPHMSGFRVSDLLRQAVQMNQIRVDIEATGGETPDDSAIDNFKEDLAPPKQDEAPVQDEAPIDAGNDTSGMNFVSPVDDKEEPMPEDAGDEYMSDDNLPEVFEPQYPMQKKTSPIDDELRKSASAIDLPDTEPVADLAKKKDSVVVDDFDPAVKMAFIGCGQGGGRIAQSMYDMGYRRVCCVNTTEQDLSPLTVPNKLVVGNNRGGAGKDPAQGELAAKESYEDIMDLMMRSWGDGVEHMMLMVGAGGGSGTGSWPTVLKAMKEYGDSTNVEKPIEKHLGIVMTMPKRSEGARVQKNALESLKQAVKLSEDGKISTLIIVDNAKVHELYPGLSVKKFWRVANQNFAAMFHTFNILAAKDSEYQTFDRADFRSVLRNGILIFGMTRVNNWQGKEDISQAVRQNLAGSLLADGFDLSKANMAGAVVVAHDDVLEDVPMENIDYALFSLGRIIGNEGVTIHSGIYEGSSPGMRVFTIVSGLEAPGSRLEELDRLSA